MNENLDFGTAESKNIKELIENKSSDEIYFFERKSRNSDGIYYSTHFKDAEYLALSYDNTLLTIKIINDIPSRSVSFNSFDSIVVDLLLNKHKKIQILTPTKNNNFEFSISASPGNFGTFEEIVFKERNIPSIMSIQHQRKKDKNYIGLSFISMSKIYLCEFFDNEQFNLLESIIVQTGTTEVLLETKEKILTEILERCDVLVTLKKNLKESDFEKLLKETFIDQSKYPIAILSLKYLVSHLRLLEDDTNLKLFKIKEYNPKEHLRLDHTVLNSFHLLPTGERGSKSLYSLLNKCKTKIGSRKLEEWIRRPLTDLESIEKRLNIVEVFIKENEISKKLDNSLKKVPDLDLILRKFKRKSGSLKEIVLIYFLIKELDKMIEIFDNIHPLSEYSNLLKTISKDFEKLSSLIEKMIDFTKIDKHLYMINPEFDNKLKDLKDDLDKKESQLEKIRSTAEDELETKVEIKNDDVYGKYLRVPRSKESNLRENEKYEMLNVLKGGIKFTTSNFKKTFAKYQEILEEYERSQKEIQNKIIDVVLSYSSLIEDTSEIISQIDILLSFAKLSNSSKNPFSRPKFGDKIKLKDSRHPILEEMIDFIPNDIELNREKRFCVITGANMGGKSTFIRQVALSVIMAQMGCYIPCSEGTIEIRNSIFSRVGASDYQQKGISTFMSEMLETASIIENSTKDSLIIIDELGRGTSTIDGFSLAYAISEHIITKIGAYCLFATHFHELSELQKKYKNVQNLKMTFVNEGTLKMLYKVENGICDESFGLYVAELTHFPKKIIQLSKRKIQDLKGQIEDETPRKKVSSEIVDYLKSFCLNKIE